MLTTTTVIIGLLITLVGGGTLVAIINRVYRRVPPSQALVIYGRGETRFVTGRGTIVSPILEEYQYIDLTVKTVKKEKDEVYTTDGIPILLDWVAQVQVQADEEHLRIAAKAFLGKTSQEIQLIITETLSANFRAIVGRMTVEEIHRDRDAFVLTVQELASDDMAAMGLGVITMGIEEITDNKGYFSAMAAPQIAAVKRDALIAEAEADREARVKAAGALREAEQAELDAQREILQQKQAFELRQVEMEKAVGLEQAKAQQDVERERALAVEQSQEAEVLVPARAKREATQIEADAERKKVVIVADAEASALRKRKEAEAELIRLTAQAEAEALEKTGNAEAAKFRALREAEAEGTRATLLAEAEGRAKLAEATAAEGEINLRQFVIETLAQADIEKTAHLSQALAGVGQNVKIVQFGSENGSATGITLLDMLMNIPEMATVLNAKIEALSGEGIDTQVARVLRLLSETRVKVEPQAEASEGNGQPAPEVESTDE